MIEIINQDLFESKSKYIAHQCNCVSKGSAGLAKLIFEKYPYSNSYFSRKNNSVPGTILITGDGKEKRYIINMYSQFFPGKFGNQNDSEDDRLKYFQECLEKILIFADGDISFPFGIGCGLAGGNWNNYYSLINNFSKEYNFNVFICKK